MTDGALESRDLTALRDEISQALDKAVDPCSFAAGRPMGLVEMGLVERIDIAESGQATIALTLTSPSCMMLGQIIDQIDAQVAPLTGGVLPRVTFDDGLSWTPNRIRGSAREHREERHQVLVQLGRPRH